MDASTVLLKMSRTRETPASYSVNGKIVRTNRVGEFPMLWIEECPVHGDVVLANGYCEKCQQDWSAVGNDARVATRVAIREGAIGYGTKAEINTLANLAKTTGKAGILAIPGVELVYNEMADDQTLPVLRRRFSAHNGKACPFYSK